MARDTVASQPLSILWPAVGHFRSGDGPRLPNVGRAVCRGQRCRRFCRAMDESKVLVSQVVLAVSVHSVLSGWVGAGTPALVGSASGGGIAMKVCECCKVLLSVAVLVFYTIFDDTLLGEEYDEREND